MGGAFGLIKGYLDGDRGWQLAIDFGADAAAGTVAGLLDDPAAAVAISDDLLDAAGQYALNAGVATSAEIARQELNYGCVRSLTSVAAAAIGGVGADASTSADDVERGVQALIRRLRRTFTDWISGKGKY